MGEDLRAAVKSMMRGALNPTCKRLPAWMARALLERWSCGLEMTLCLHRVGEKRRRTDPLPTQTIPPTSLDEFLEIARRARDLGDGPERLTLSFDDGYRDAVDYVASRAPRYPEVDWIVFVCPEKLTVRAGFRWDLWETGAKSDHEPLSLEVVQQDTHPAFENRRPELHALGDAAGFELATIESCRSLLDHPNVALGNHTNTHLALARVDEEAAREEIEGSTALFRELFGDCHHFAFPFGVPGRDFGTRDVEIVREAAPNALLWSSEQRPYFPGERQLGAVLPRIGAPGMWNPKTLAVWLALLGRRQITRTAPKSATVSPERVSESTGDSEDAVASARS